MLICRQLEPAEHKPFVLEAAAKHLIAIRCWSRIEPTAGDSDGRAAMVQGGGGGDLDTAVGAGDPRFNCSCRPLTPGPPRTACYKTSHLRPNWAIYLV